MSTGLTLGKTEIWYTAKGKSVRFFVPLAWTNHCHKDMCRCMPSMSCHTTDEREESLLNVCELPCNIFMDQVGLGIIQFCPYTYSLRPAVFK